MRARIAVLPGDGIGPEVTAAAVAVLRRIGELCGHQFAFDYGLIGGAPSDATGRALPDATRELVLSADAVLLGAVGGPKWPPERSGERPEQGLLDLRRLLGVFANLRPVATHAALSDASPLKPDRLDGVDLVVVRELTGGIYFGDKHRSENDAVDVCRYSVAEVERVVRVAARLAAERRGRLTSIDKSNVLETSRLWRDVTNRIVADEFPTLILDHLLVDAAAMHLLDRPSSFDVIVTENMFGDILTDEASMLAGSLGLLPSASLGAPGDPGLYEPIHGSAPDIAGQGLANPCGAIASAALLLRLSLGLAAEADAIDDAVRTTIENGYRTTDIANGFAPVDTEAMTEKIAEALRPEALSGAR